MDKIPVFGRIRTEFQSLEGERQNSNVCKDKVIISMLGKITSEF